MSKFSTCRRRRGALVRYRVRRGGGACKCSCVHLPCGPMYVPAGWHNKVLRTVIVEKGQDVAEQNSPYSAKFKFPTKYTFFPTKYTYHLSLPVVSPN